MSARRYLQDLLFPERLTALGELIERLAAGVDPENVGVYLGVGPDQNFTYIAHLQPSWSFILDHRRRNLRLHLLHKALFELAENRVAYLKRLTAREPKGLPDDPSAEELVAVFERARFDPDLLKQARVEVFRRLRPLGVLRPDEWRDLATIQARIAGPGMKARFLAMPIHPTFAELILTRDRDGRRFHMLTSEDLYQRVRAAQRAHRIAPLVADWAGTTALPTLAGWLNDQGLEVATVYVSDVEFFLLRAGRFDAYLANLERLPRRPDARIIRSSTRPIDHSERLPDHDATTIVRPLEPFLEAARAGRIADADDLFEPSED